MIISNNQIRSLLALYKQQEKDVSTDKKEEMPKKFHKEAYNSAIEKDARVFSAAKEAINELPDLRMERLARIEKQVKTGTYEVTEEEVAEKMIGRSLVDKLI